MHVEFTGSKIFIKEQSVDLSPKIISKRNVDRVVRLQTGERIIDREEVVKVEIACLIDQRALIEADISRLPVFVSTLPRASRQVRPNLVIEAVSPKITPKKEISGLFDRRPATRSAPRAETSVETAERQIREMDEARTPTKKQSIDNVSNVIFDIDRINQGSTIDRMADKRFLTMFNVNQHLSSAKIKDIAGLQQPDNKLFGVRKVMFLRRYTNNAYREVPGSQQEVTTAMPTMENNSSTIQEVSVDDFRNEFFKQVKNGKDPAFNFAKTEDSMTVEDRMRGTMSIQKERDSKLKDLFRKIAEKRISDTSENDLGFKIFKTNIVERNKIYKATFEMSKSKMRRLIGVNGRINLEIQAVNSSGIIVQNQDVMISFEKLFQTATNPTLDYDISCSRSSRGSIVTKITNDELNRGRFKLYQKTFSKSQNYKNARFGLRSIEVDVLPNNSTTVFDGSSTKQGTPKISETKSVYQRMTTRFNGAEIGNTKVTSVGSRFSPREQLSCSIYVTTKENDERSVNVVIGNISEDVVAVLPVKRIARGNRGTDFKPIKVRSEINGPFSLGNAGNLTFNSKSRLVPVTKTAVDLERVNTTLQFDDDDVETDVIYEYAAFLFNRSGEKQLSSSRFLEKTVPREGLVTVAVESVKPSSDDKMPPSNIDKITRDVKFKVDLVRQEDDVDKILNSIFGDNRTLFNEDLLEIKDASNLVYGVRVHRIDEDTGENVFVGSFRAFKQDSAEDSASTDIPKTFKTEVLDVAPAFSAQIYKFEPYVLPPAQVLDKIFSLLERLVRQGNSTNNTLHKLFVGKQKLLNQDIVSQIGSKFASVSGNRGATSDTKSFLENNRNDLFLEGETGDTVYEEIAAIGATEESLSLEFEEKQASKIATLDRDARTKSYIPKNLVQLSFLSGPTDSIMDFYIVTRQYNADPSLIIDGVIHSRDDQQSSIAAEGQSYVYLSNPKTNIGLVKYYVFGVTKSGNVIGPSLFPGVTYEGF